MDTVLLSTFEQRRQKLSKSTEAEKKAHLGQFLTPERTAAFMASLFPDGKGYCRLLDAGAGIGSLSAAFLDSSVFENYPYMNKKNEKQPIDFMN